MRIIILVIASNNSEHERDLLSQKKTWVNNCHTSVTVIYLRGWNQDYYFKNGDTIFVPCPELYSNILNKTILGLRYLLANCDFDILIRSNVSTYFETQLIVKELDKRLYKKSFFGGYFERTKDSFFLRGRGEKFISGAGIFMSRDAADELSCMDPDKYRGVPDDVAIYNFLSKTKIREITMPRNNIQITHIFIPTFYIRLKNSSNPDSVYIRMNLIHQFFQSENVRSKIKAYLNIQLNELFEIRNNSDSNYLALKNFLVNAKYFIRQKLIYYFNLFN